MFKLRNNGSNTCSRTVSCLSKNEFLSREKYHDVINENRIKNKILINKMIYDYFKNRADKSSTNKLTKHEIISIVN
jgi:hypothetical protein